MITLQYLLAGAVDATEIRVHDVHGTPRDARCSCLEEYFTVTPGLSASSPVSGGTVFVGEAPGSPVL